MAIPKCPFSSSINYWLLTMTTFFEIAVYRWRQIRSGYENPNLNDRYCRLINSKTCRCIRCIILGRQQIHPRDANTNTDARVQKTDGFRHRCKIQENFLLCFHLHFYLYISVNKPWANSWICQIANFSQLYNKCDENPQHPTTGACYCGSLWMECICIVLPAW